MNPYEIRLRPRPPYLHLFAADLFVALLEAIPAGDVDLVDDLTEELAALWLDIRLNRSLDPPETILAATLFARYSTAAEHNRLNPAVNALGGLHQLGVRISIRQPHGPHRLLGWLVAPGLSLHHSDLADLPAGTVTP